MLLKVQNTVTVDRGRDTGRPGAPRRRFGQYATHHAAFIQLRRFRPLGRLFFEATLRLLSLRPDDLLTIL